MEFVIKDIGIIYNNRKDRIDDNWSEVESEIVLNDDIPENALKGLNLFSHIEVIFYFHKLPAHSDFEFERLPRGIESIGLIGIFAQRASNRLNKIGNSICKLISIEGKKLKVKGLDAINGTPVLDLKPVFIDFLPSKNDITEPAWVRNITKNYW